MPEFETHTAEAEKKIAEKPEEVEKLIKDLEMTVDDASRTAKDQIDAIISQAHAKIAPTDDDLNSDEVQPYLNRLADARDAAEKSIDDNRERYTKIKAFVDKKVGAEVTLEMNEATYPDIAGSVDIKDAATLLTVAKGLRDTKTDLSGLEAPGMETEKTDLLQKIEDQAAEFEKRAGEIKEHISGRIGEQDAAIANVDKALKAGEKPNVTDVTLVENHYKYLSQVAYFMDQNMADDPLHTLITDKVNAMEPVMEAMDTHAGKSAEYSKASAKEQKMGVNLYAAQSNLEKVMADPNATTAERAAARGWLAGAKQAYASAENAMLEERHKTFAGGERGIPKVREGVPVVQPEELPVATEEKKEEEKPA